MSRFADIDLSTKKLTPIDGYLTQPLVSLKKSLELITPHNNQLEQFIEIAEQNCHFPNEHSLTKDESAAIYLYTIEYGDDSFYRAFNRALRSEDRAALLPWFPFLKLFHTAVHKLPLVKKSIWRGLREDVSAMYAAGLELTWWSVSSCSLSVNVIKHFLGPNSTLFLIEALNGRRMSGYTKYENENEVILPPGTRLRVVSNALNHEGGLHVIHSTELSDDERSPSALSLFTWIKKKKIVLVLCLTLLVIAITMACIGGTGLFRRQETTRPSTKSTIKTPSLAPSPSNRPPPDPMADSVFCRQWARVRSCASRNCSQISDVTDNNTYPADCYIVGEIVTDGIIYDDVWYRLNLPSGDYGYVTGLYCNGRVGLCD